MPNQPQTGVKNENAPIDAEAYTHRCTAPDPDPMPDISRQVPPPCPDDQCALDIVELSSMESFPCSDPPCYTTTHA